MTSVVDDGVEVESALLGSLFSPEARRDPHPLFRAASLPGCRYDAVEAMLRDARLGPPLIAPSDEPFWELFRRWLINLDGERHARLRRHFARLFTPRHVEDYRPVIERTASGLLDRVEAAGSMDVVVDFAQPLPFSVIAGVLGVPEQRREWLRERMLTLGQGFARQTEPEYVSRASTAVTEMLELYSKLLADRAVRPRDDLLSVLASDVPDDEDGLQDVLANCIFFVEAGHATTTSLISGGALLLLERPDQLDRLSGDRALLPGAVEEMLRLITPVTAVICRPREDMELCGFRFCAGERRFAFLAAANRDPDVFADPDRFEVARRDIRHLAFSAGAHFCLGAPLARLHGEIAVAMMLRRLPGLRLARAPEWRSALPLRQLEHLFVSWDTP